MNVLKKLSQELINQIAAGEVIERPASIIKELVDNSIDAGATKIRIKVEDGGIKKIEVTDNGIGIKKDDLETVFEAHTTSKISNIEDLSNIQTMGFRGEALSTIVSVAHVTAISKHKDEEYGYEISFDGITPKPIKKSPKEQGTTFIIEDIFYNVPARKKFLKTPETEYRKILEILYPYFMLYNNIHFSLAKNGKEVLNLPPVQGENALIKDRLNAVLKSNFTSDMFEFSSEGAGMTIYGLSAHPKDNFERTSHQYIFVNKRPIWDSGVSKSVHSAYSRFIPNTQKIPFIILINIQPHLVDVNVHPRKEEIKFENPFRVYSMIEEAILKALQSTAYQTNTSYASPQSNTFNTPQARTINDKPSMFGTYDRGNSNEIRFDKSPKDFSIRQSLEFSKQILQSEHEQTSDNSAEIRSVFQIFNKYIVIEFEKELLMIDQHAAAERITFEKLTKSFESKIYDVQHLLVPTEITLTDAEESYMIETKNFFEKLGFRLEIDKSVLKISSIPSMFTNFNIEELFKSIWDLSSEERDIEKSFEIAKENILATLACHGSIRKGQKLTPQEGLQLYKDLMRCDNTYSCPHGRPAIWKLKLTDIDTNFYRTY